MSIKQGIMKSKIVVYIVGFFVVSLGTEVWGGDAGSDNNICSFPAIYNFGDSNSDTGASSAAFTGVHPPNGENFFGTDLSGRFCDGRLLIDFITEELKLPYLSAYLNSVGSNYRHGANFATGGSSIAPGGYSPFHLGIQVPQFIQFKSRTNVIFNQLSQNGTDSPFKSSLPRPEDFSKALYTFDIGQNDLSYGFQHTTEEQVRASIPNILTLFSQALQVSNEGPVSSCCITCNYITKEQDFSGYITLAQLGPYSFIYYKSKQRNLDANGCVKPQNEIAQEFNRQLKDLVFQLRTKLPLAKFTYVDVYSAKYQLISNAKNQGFVNPLEFCCGGYYGYHIDCGKKAIVNGTVYGNPCKNPSQHVSWDGIHYSQAANLWIAKQILHGSFTDPPVPIGQACF